MSGYEEGGKYRASMRIPKTKVGRDERIKRSNESFNRFVIKNKLGNPDLLWANEEKVKELQGLRQIFPDLYKERAFRTSVRNILIGKKSVDEMKKQISDLIAAHQL